MNLKQKSRIGANFRILMKKTYKKEETAVKEPQEIATVRVLCRLLGNMTISLSLAIEGILTNTRAQQKESAGIYGPSTVRGRPTSCTLLPFLEPPLSSLPSRY